jgi:hypothetical protein
LVLVSKVASGHRSLIDRSIIHHTLHSTAVEICFGLLASILDSDFLLFVDLLLICYLLFFFLNYLFVFGLVSLHHVSEQRRVFVLSQEVALAQVPYMLLVLLRVASLLARCVPHRLTTVCYYSSACLLNL